jgi:hypothetical protein
MDAKGQHLGFVNHATRAVSWPGWRSPLVQVRLLMGAWAVAALWSLFPHSPAHRESEFNPLAAALATNLSPDQGYRPTIHLNAPPKAPAPSPASPASPSPAASALAASARKAALDAAHAPSWSHLHPSLRHEVSERLASFPSTPAVRLRWSNTHAGNAASLDAFHSRWRGQPLGTPADFIIGNGHRAPDGAIEPTARWRLGNPTDAITICLIGHPGHVSPAQQAAIGELIVCLESRIGTLAIHSSQPTPPTMLAAAE